MNDKKLNRIFRYIETEGGLDTSEYEFVIATLNRLYIKRIILQEGKRDVLGFNVRKTSDSFKADSSHDNSKKDRL